MQLAVCEFARNELGWEGDVPTVASSFAGVPKLVLLHCVSSSAQTPTPRSLTQSPSTRWCVTPATTSEPTADVRSRSESVCPQVIDMPEHNPGQMGGTMRLGKRRTIFKSPSSILRKGTHPERGGCRAARFTH